MLAPTDEYRSSIFICAAREAPSLEPLYARYLWPRSSARQLATPGGCAAAQRRGAGLPAVLRAGPERAQGAGGEPPWPLRGRWVRGGRPSVVAARAGGDDVYVPRVLRPYGAVPPRGRLGAGPGVCGDRLRPAGAWLVQRGAGQHR